MFDFGLSWKSTMNPLLAESIFLFFDGEVLGFFCISGRTSIYVTD